METELERLRRANDELQAWVRDLLEENRFLRGRIAEHDGDEPHDAARAALRSAPV